jgi:hypothetical protein
MKKLSDAVLCMILTLIAVVMCAATMLFELITRAQ